jgi:hypothetical protein
VGEWSSKPNLSQFLCDDDLYRRAGTAFLAAAGSSPDTTQEVIVDGEQTLDILAFVAAMILEYNPGNDTPQRLRLASESFARRVNDHARAIRAESDQRDRPVIEEFGAYNRMVAGTA